VKNFANFFIGDKNWKGKIYTIELLWDSKEIEKINF